jgi:membrane fusion protein, copper/silver efflux system
MHPAVTADHAGASCRECNGMVLEPRLVSFQPAGKVLAVPESAVVDTGLRKVVFVATMPGTFDGVEVELGPRCGGFYPVIRGAQAGQQVAVAGAFLLDAETRLNPSLAASYFGATGRDIPASAPRSAAIAGPREDPSPLGRLATPDRGLAERQKSCPVTGKALGSMGTPTRVVVAGRVVFLCCEGCEDALRSEPAKYLAKLPAESRP